MYVVQAGDDLEENGGDKAASESPAFAGLDEMIQISFHGLENEVEFLCSREKEEIIQGNDIGVERYCSERLAES